MYTSSKISKMQTKKRVCGVCLNKPAVFHVRNRRTGSIVVKADKDHTFCPKCWNAMLDSSGSRISYKKNVLSLKGNKAEFRYKNFRVI